MDALISDLIKFNETSVVPCLIYHTNGVPQGEVLRSTFWNIILTELATDVFVVQTLNLVVTHKGF